MANEKKLRRAKARTLRKENALRIKPSTWLIVCEGIETEKNYFSKAIEYFNNDIDSEYRIRCKIEGKGMNTVSLVKATDNIINYIDKCNTTPVPYGKIFVVFDKDDFSEADFNEAVRMCNERGYIPLWSNEAIEVWFLLYFSDVTPNMSRKEYIDKLNEWFKKYKLGITYKKNDLNIFANLMKYGKHDLAVQRARKIMNSYIAGGISPSLCSSCTNVFKFFDEIDKRIEELK